MNPRSLNSNIFLTGFSGSGKTIVGRKVASLLGWRFVDLDSEIARETGKSVEVIFAEMGELYFRQLESDCLKKISIGKHQVISTGGGVVVEKLNRDIMHQNGVVVCLEARPETIYRRLEDQIKGNNPVVRPMLVDANPMEKICSLKRERQFSYASAEWTVHTDKMTPEEVAGEIIRAWRRLTDDKISSDSQDEKDLAAVVRTSSRNYPVWVGWGSIDKLGQTVKNMLSPSVAYIIGDEGVRQYVRQAQASIEASGIPAHVILIPPGESNKSLETVHHLYTWLAERKAERGHLVLAVGGGMVGDLAGFVAATFVRGMPFVQVPTTLLAMADSSIGGKVAFDLPRAKNMVGAFHQPHFVMADVQTLGTLPQREITSGWAEVIKYGLILDEEFLSVLEKQKKFILALKRDVTTDVIRRSVSVKADIVSRDEEDTLDIRMILNYGHTIGHAIEVATNYGRFLHGEAVSVGMMGAAYIGYGMGLMSARDVERQRVLLEGFGLPLSCSGVDVFAVNEAMGSDKKTSGKTIRWVLLNGIGEAVTRNDVPANLVQETLRRLTQ